MYNQHPYNAIMYNGVLYALRKAKASGSGVGTIITEPLIDILTSSQGSGEGIGTVDYLIELLTSAQGKGIGILQVENFLIIILPRNSVGSGIGLGEGYGFILPLFSEYTKIMALLIKEENLKAWQ